MDTHGHLHVDTHGRLHVNIHGHLRDQVLERKYTRDAGRSEYFTGVSETASCGRMTRAGHIRVGTLVARFTLVRGILVLCRSIG